MKKLFVLMLLLAGHALAQTYTQTLDGRKWFSMDAKDVWIIGQAQNDSTDYFNQIRVGVSRFSDIIKSYPYMSLQAVTSDTATATDSIRFKVELWGSVFNDTTKMSYLVDLNWSKTASIYDSTYISSAGYWMCNPTETAIANVYYMALKVVPAAGNAVTSNGVRSYFYLTGRK